MRIVMGCWLMAAVLGGCGGLARTKSAESAAVVAPAPAEPAAEMAPPAPAPASASLGEADSSASLQAAVVPVVARREAAGGAAAPPPLAQTPGVTRVESTEVKPVRMLDIEARLTIEVKDVARAAQQLRALAVRSGGEVVQESLTDADSAPRGQLTLRVPARGADAFLGQVEDVGSVTSRQVTVNDLGKQYYDASLRLQNLQWALARYEQILARANNVDEILRVEQQIARVRGEIEQIKGELRYMQDRAARATVHVSLLGPEAVQERPVENPTAKLFPGIRFGYLRDFRGDDGSAGYLGGGVSLRMLRRLSIDLEGLRATDTDSQALQLFLASFGGELYSEFLGGGRRKWLNPFLGFRAGYARFLKKNEIVAGGSIGVEIFKSEIVSVEFDTRIYGMFGSSAGAHMTVQPALGMNIAF
jgi:hypothetical protein